MYVDVRFKRPDDMTDSEKASPVGAAIVAVWEAAPRAAENLYGKRNTHDWSSCYASETAVKVRAPDEWYALQQAMYGAAEPAALEAGEVIAEAEPAKWADYIGALYPHAVERGFDLAAWDLRRTLPEEWAVYMEAMKTARPRLWRWDFIRTTTLRAYGNALEACWEIVKSAAPAEAEAAYALTDDGIRPNLDDPHTAKVFDALEYEAEIVYRQLRFLWDAIDAARAECRNLLRIAVVDARSLHTPERQPTEKDPIVVI